MNALVATGALTPLDALPPCAETVVALAECQGCQRAEPLRALLLRDPGALLSYVCLNAGQARLWPPDSAAATAAQAVLQLFLQRNHDLWADWHVPEALPAHRYAMASGRIAQRLAALTHVDPDQAQVAGILAPLGWLLQASHLDSQPDDPALLGRRILRRLSLPTWLSRILLHLDLPVDPAPVHRLTLVVQAATALAKERWPKAISPCNIRPQAALRLLGLDEGMRQELQPLLDAEERPPTSTSATLVGRLLRLTTGHARQQGGHLLGNLESELEAVRERLGLCLQNEQLRLEQMKLESVAEFAAGAAHEINTPLAIISGQAQHLLRSEEDPERMQTLERIVSQAQRIHVLLRDLLTFARPPQLKPKRMDATAFVHSVVEGLRSYAVRKQVRLEIVKTRKVYVRGDAHLLENAVAALVRNALEAAPSGGSARVTIAPAGNTDVLISIEDDGPGLTAQQREHLFDPFYSGRAAGRGAGLGLSKAWRIAQLHGGTVELSADGGPTRFTLRLPAAATRAKRKPKHRPRPQRAAARRK